jgi:ubiquinone biosynthesis protein COQ4
LNYDVTVAEELAVKWFELIQLGLPSTALAAFFGPLNLLFIQRNLSEMNRLTRIYLPHVLQQASSCGFFMNIYYERHFETDVEELRYRLGIKALREYNK